MRIPQVVEVLEPAKGIEPPTYGLRVYETVAEEALYVGSMSYSSSESGWSTSVGGFRSPFCSPREARPGVYRPVAGELPCAEILAELPLSKAPNWTLADMNLLWYIVLNKVQDGRRPTAAKNPAGFLSHGGG